MAQSKKLSDSDILALVEQKVRHGVGFVDSRLSAERERVLKYYNSQLPKRQNEGRSSYVATDVYDSVEMAKAQLIETFSGNPDNIISFPPLNDKDIESSRIATEYCSYQIWRMNDGFGMIRDVIHNGQIGRAHV